MSKYRSKLMSTTKNEKINQKPLILLVDDIPENIQILHQILNTGEYSFAIASSGEETLQLVKEKIPDLILLDVMMGDMDGFEVCGHLKKDPKTADIPVVFLTAKVELEDKVTGLELGAVDYITKPFEAAEVSARVHTHIRLKQTMDLVKECNMQLNENLAEMLFSFQDLQRSQEERKQTDTQSTIKNITDDATHEINQPLTVLQGYLELLKETVAPGCFTSAQMKYMDRMENSLRKLMVTVENFRKGSAGLDSIPK